MCANGLYLGAALVLLALLAAALSRAREGSGSLLSRARALQNFFSGADRAEAFSLAAPSPPLVGDAVNALEANLCRFLASTGPSRTPTGSAAVEAGPGIRWIRASLTSALALARAPPTYENHRALYEGLRRAVPALPRLAESLRAGAAGPLPNCAADSTTKAAHYLDAIAQNIERLGAALG